MSAVGNAGAQDRYRGGLIEYALRLDPSQVPRRPRFTLTIAPAGYGCLRGVCGCGNWSLVHDRTGVIAAEWDQHIRETGYLDSHSWDGVAVPGELAPPGLSAGPSPQGSIR